MNKLFFILTVMAMPFPVSGDNLFDKLVNTTGLPDETKDTSAGSDLEWKSLRASFPNRR